MGLETYPPLELAMLTVVSIEQLYLLGFGRLQSTDCYDFAVYTFKYQKKKKEFWQSDLVLKSASLGKEKLEGRGGLQSNCLKKHEIPNPCYLMKEIQGSC